MSSDRPRPDDPLFTNSTFHQWWLAEMRSSVAPTTTDAPAEPEARAPEPSAPPNPASPARLFFWCAAGLLGGTVTTLILGEMGPAPDPRPARSPQGIVEVGEILVLSPAPEPAPGPVVQAAVATDAPVVAQSPAAAPPFDSSAAAEAARKAAENAARCSDGVSTGSASVALTFARSGEVKSAVLQGELKNRRIAECITRRMRAARVPSFSGPEATVHQLVEIR
jgi:hypothetical protein